jgi:membrane protease YdiL (CAAX protease family)
MQTGSARGSSPRWLFSFFPLAFLLSWYPTLLRIAAGVGDGGINPLGPLAAGIVLTAVEGRWTGLRGYLSRAFRLRIAPRWYAFVVLFPIAVACTGGAANVLLGAHPPTAAQLSDVGGLLPRFAFILLFIGFGEEMGWRGYALPRLLGRFTPLAASLVLAAFWAAWHIPLMRTELKPPFIAPFVIGLTSATVLSTWIYRHTEGSVIPQAVFHSVVNTVGGGYVFRFFSGDELTRLWWIYAGLWALAAGIVVARGGLAGDAVASVDSRRAMDAEDAMQPAVVGG